jgi:hypothetical protein
VPKLAPPHVASVDVVSVAVYTLSAVLGISVMKLVAYKYHGHPLSQAVLLFL